MDLSTFTAKELSDVNFLYDEIEDVDEEIIYKLADPNKIFLYNKKSGIEKLIHSENLFMVGLNKIIIDEDYESCYPLVKSFLDNGFNKTGETIYDYLPNGLFLSAIKRIVAIAADIDFHKGIQNYKSIESAVRFVQDNFFSELALFDAYSEESIENKIFNSMMYNSVVEKIYEGVSTPNEFFSYVIYDSDLKTFSSLIVFCNYYLSREGTNNYSSIPSSETVLTLQKLAREADYGKRIADLDVNHGLPKGVTERALPQMFVMNQAQALSKKEIDSIVRTCAFSAYNNLDEN